MSAFVGTASSERTSIISAGSPRSAARRARINMLPRSPYVDRRSGYTQTMRSALSVARSVDTVQLRSDVLERGVVRDHLDPSGRYGAQRLGKRIDVHERDVVDLQSHGEVERALPGDQHRPPVQRRKVDVEEPRRIETVRIPAIDRQ